jgi:hypothetical protein
MSLLPTFSFPGWTQATIAVISILSQLKSLYDPSSFMTTYDIPSIPAAKLIGKPPTPESQIIPHIRISQSVSNAF